MTEDQFFHESVEAACAAPSADNNQPWKFEQTKSGLNVYWDFDRRLPSDVDGMFDLLSLGAVIENITLKLASLGQSAEVDLASSSQENFSVGVTSDLRRVATISFSSTAIASADEELSKFIDARHTSRFPYTAKSLELETLDEIQRTSVRNDRVQLMFERDRAKIKRIASLVALSDSIRFRYRDFHEELHRQLRLTPQHAEQSQDGLDYRTLALPPGGKFVLRALRNWNTMSFLNQFGMAKLLAAPSARIVRASGAIGFIYLDDRSPQSMINGGRTMQRMWLQATKMGLAVHPLGSLAIFLANDNLPAELKPIAKRLSTNAAELLPLPNRFLQLAFRIGVARRIAPVRSLRRNPQDVTVSNLAPSMTAD